MNPAAPANRPPMDDPRIIDVELDERSILRRSEEIEREKKVAIFDLLEDNRFAPSGHNGPFRVFLRIEDDRLAIDLKDSDHRPLDTIRLGLARFRRPIRDYFTICDSYFRAIRNDRTDGIATVDMARRALHNEGAKLLRQSFAGRIDMDFDTARRLFTLLCVLHIKA